MRILHDAMQDTPPTDIVHIMAKELIDIFNANWQKKNVWWIDHVPTAPPQKKLKAETVKTKSANAPVLENSTCKAKKRQQLKTNRSAVKKSNLELSESIDIGAAVSERNHQQIPHIQAASSGPGISKTNIQRSCVKDPCTPKIEQPLHAHRCPVNSTTLEPCKDGVATSELDNTRSIEHDASSLAGAGKGPHNNHPPEEQFSPTKVLHVKRMNARYADIIKKAQHYLQLDGVQTDNKLELAEKQSESKMQREKKREAARIALNELEMQREKEDLEKLDQKEKKPKFENGSKIKREMKREAARMALNEGSSGETLKR
ncbi:hypothetical protein J5N97_012989 [Dioscorea zingiberensis]|uniref:Uncharacterized protein n=1 Tax=Dioscorea zingiberensis TaxID=325984 RepID=A0A9D5CSI5_9LILI|nr:hypothetical protein J5N97_012989 [Dioscorea zingiberensis]